MKGSIVFIIKFVLPAITTLVVCLIMGQAMVNDSNSLLVNILQGLIAGVFAGFFASKMYAPDVDNPGRLAIYVATATFCAVLAPTVVSAVTHSAPNYHIACEAQPAGINHKYC